MKEFITYLLETSDEDAKAAIQRRLEELKVNNDEEETMYKDSSRSGFIGKNVSLTPSSGNSFLMCDVLPVYFDDEEIYYNFLTFIKKQDESIKRSAAKRLDVFLFLLFKFETELLGHPYEIDPARSFDAHTKPDIIGLVDEREKLSIKDFYGQNTAQCFERALITQNLLSFFGIDSSLILGQLESEGKEEPHAFNIFKYGDKDREYLLDLTNPAIFTNEEGTKKIFVPLIMPFTPGEKTFYFDSSIMGNLLGLRDSGLSIKEIDSLSKMRYTVPDSFMKNDDKHID